MVVHTVTAFAAFPSASLEIIEAFVKRLNLSGTDERDAIWGMVCTTNEAFTTEMVTKWGLPGAFDCAVVNSPNGLAGVQFFTNELEPNNRFVLQIFADPSSTVALTVKEDWIVCE